MKTYVEVRKAAVPDLRGRDEIFSVKRNVDVAWCRAHERGNVRCFGARGLVASGSYWASEAVRFTLHQLKQKGTD